MKYVITRQLVIDFVDDKIFVITPTSQTSYVIYHKIKEVVFMTSVKKR